MVNLSLSTIFFRIAKFFVSITKVFGNNLAQKLKMLAIRPEKTKSIEMRKLDNKLAIVTAIK
jgi:hypothetical protein